MNSISSGWKADQWFSVGGLWPKYRVHVCSLEVTASVNANIIENHCAKQHLYFHINFVPFSRLQFDMDGDGSITTEELRCAMSKLLGEHMNHREIDAVVQEADNNGDGTVDFEGEQWHTFSVHDMLDKSSIYRFSHFLHIYVLLCLFLQNLWRCCQAAEKIIFFWMLQIHKTCKKQNDCTQDRICVDVNITSTHTPPPPSPRKLCKNLKLSMQY